MYNLIYHARVICAYVQEFIWSIVQKLWSFLDVPLESWTEQDHNVVSVPVYSIFNSLG